MGLGFSPLKDKKFLSIIFLFLLFSISIPLVTLFFRDQIKQKFFPLNLKLSTTPKVIREGKINQIADPAEQDFFFANLEYDPKSGSVIQRDTGRIKADLVPLYPSQPKDVSNAAFVYKIEVISKERELLQSSWGVTLKKIIQTSQGTFNFEVVVIYRPNSVIKVYIPENKGDKLIWTGRMV